MSTEPQINNLGFAASLTGAIFALFLPIGHLLIFAIFEVISPPENPENDGYLKGYAMMIALMIPLFFVYFIYFLFLCINKNISLKSLLIISIAIPSSIALLVNIPFDEPMSWNGFTPVLLASMFFSCSLCIGSWGWHRTLKTYKKLIKS